MITYYLAWDSGFKIQIEKYEKMNFKKKKKIRKSKYVSTIVLSSYFTQKLVLSYAGAFHKNSLSMACGTFGKLKIRKNLWSWFCK